MSDAEHREGEPAEEIPALVPVSALAAHAYCPRLFHLQWVQGEREETADLLAGRREHRAVDRAEGDLPSPEQLAGPGFRATSLDLSAPGEGLIARLDALEGADGRVIPVEHKHGAPPDGDGQVWDADRIQVGAQALVLREAGYRCEEALVWYRRARRRVRVAVDEQLVEDVRRELAEARRVAARDTPPLPLVDSPKCPRCSLVGICLPDETNLEVQAREGDGEVRRLVPARDDAQPVYVQAQGARIGKRGEELLIEERDAGRRKVRCIDTSHVSVFGNVQVSAQALALLLARGVPLCHFSYGGWFRGMTAGWTDRNVVLRMAQYEVARDPGRRLALSRLLVEGKIRNSRTLLRRNAQGDVRRALEQLTRLADEALGATSVERLLGIEGMASRVYFGAFSSMLRPQHAGEMPFDFQGRNRRPPRDPINALLSLAYAVMAKDWTLAIRTVGLDPMLGMYHRPRFGRPGLALDLMEEFRPLVGDSTVLILVNRGELTSEDFIRRGHSCALTAEGRKKFFLAYERRMRTLIRHPRFGYRISYRRVFEVQARMFARYVIGELPAYEGFRTR